MKIGLQIPDYTYPGGPPTLGADLARIARTADDVGFDAVSVMDHLFQIHMVGPAENDMLEAYTTLGFLAAHTTKVRLFTLVTGVTYRDPGLLAKIVTTLDVLSGGRAWLGLGAAWNEQESTALGLLFPPTKERFERLEETLQICLQMWRASAGRTRRSWSAAAGRRRRCVSWPSTPRRATCSPRPSCPTSSRCCGSTVSARAPTTTRSRRPRSWSSTSVPMGRGRRRWSTS
ncbi:MAG: LLM class flavin-dependent oxidoreductase [Geodermatophilaceae bacterium]|nr:LLM class flavin-dependent oxidoreductase [Geodermatophilaceae bacterium]